MPDLSTSWMGLALKSPVIVSSSSLSGNVENVVEAARCGAGAVVLKSLFEEQILSEGAELIGSNEQRHYYAQAEDYIREYARGDALNRYLSLVEESRKAAGVPVIASINCVSGGEWVRFARDLEAAGADALEVNIFVLPSDPSRSGQENEQLYGEVVNKIVSAVRIPVAAKISSYFSSLASTTVKLSESGLGGLVLFNRFYSPDIDIETMSLKAADPFSSPRDLSHSLRWIAMLSDRVGCDLAASTGVHDGEALVKQLLAGARAVEIASVLYHKGFEEIRTMLQELEAWMERHDFNRLDQFIGRMSVKKGGNPAAWERVQFMKQFGGIE